MLRLAVHVRREQAELVLAELLDLAPSGVEETDVGEDVVEYAIYGSPGELPALPELRAVAARANDVAITVRRHDLRTQATPPARTVAANLQTPLLQQWATRLAGMASRPERVIAGGLLGEEAPQVAGAFAALGFAEVRRLSAG